MDEKEGPILYVLVIGFHHKKGCQVEYSFPPLVPEHPNECPLGWKYLPTLALPDGSHNYDQDTVFFHLPSLTKPNQTVYGISCFRQIPVEKLKNRTSDITRGTVQKSVCVLSKIPLYGQIQVKMCLITHAYFEEGDFSKVSILEDTYHHLNAVMLYNDPLDQAFVGLSARDFILQWKHKALLLFKLILLEKRVIFYKSPVHPLCTTILTLLSLFPDMIENGLNQSACIRLSRPMSPMPEFSDEDLNSAVTTVVTNGELTDSNTNSHNEEAKVHQTTNKPDHNNIEENSIPHLNQSLNSTDTEISVELPDCLKQQFGNVELTAEQKVEDGVEILKEKDDSLQTELSFDEIDAVQNNMINLSQLSTETCGFPLAIFTTGSLCLPYLSLPYLDLLTDVNVRSYVVGATNILFKQKRHLYDILVDIDNNRIECQDLSLRKYLHLTTEDLRFADYIVRHVSEDQSDVFLDGVGWEGGEEWIRTQFRIYLLCLLRTSMSPEVSRENDHFNSHFIEAWRDTHNYKIWLGGINPGILTVHPAHPFAGQLSVADMKLRLAHTMQNTESGRKINQAMASTGKVVATTSKAVGGALSQAKGAFSVWWSNFLTSPEISEKVANHPVPFEGAPCIEGAAEISDNLMNIPENSNEINKQHLINSTLTTENCNIAVDLPAVNFPGKVHTV